MITPRHPIGGAVLRWLARNPGSTVDEIAAAVLPMPPELVVPPWMTKEERRELFGVQARPALVDRHGRVRRPAIEAVPGKRDLHAQEARRRVTAVLSDLTRVGYVEARRPPFVAAWFVARVERHGITEALLGLVRWETELSAATVTAWVAMVDAAMKSPGAWRPAATGAQQETYAALVDLGVIEAPAQRWPTAAGVAAVTPGTTIGPAAVSVDALGLRGRSWGDFGGFTMTATDILAAYATWADTPPDTFSSFDDEVPREFARLYVRALVAEAEAARIEAAKPALVAARSIPLLPILDRDYSVRTHNVARDNNLLTLGDLADRTPAELLRMRNLGRRVLVDFKAVLAAHGLSFRGGA